MLTVKEEIEGIELQHKRLNLAMAYWTVFASQKKEHSLQNELMDEITEAAKSFTEGMRYMRLGEPIKAPSDNDVRFLGGE